MVAVGLFESSAAGSAHLGSDDDGGSVFWLENAVALGIVDKRKQRRPERRENDARRQRGKRRERRNHRTTEQPAKILY